MIHFFIYFFYLIDFCTCEWTFRKRIYQCNILYLLILFADMAFLNSALWSLHGSLEISEVATLAKCHLLFSWGISVIVDVLTGLSGKEFAELGGILDSEV